MGLPPAGTPRPEGGNGTAPEPQVTSPTGGGGGGGGGGFPFDDGGGLQGPAGRSLKGPFRDLGKDNTGLVNPCPATVDRYSYQPFAISPYPVWLDQIRALIFWILEEPDSSFSKVDKRAKISAAVVCLGTIVLSLICSVLETMPEFEFVPNSVWHFVEVSTNTVFTVEYLLRLWVCDVFGTSAIHWALRGTNLCDLLSLVPTYLEFMSWDSGFRWLRVLRMGRLFKICRYSQGVNVIFLALLNSLSALWILFFLIFVGMVIFAAVVYFAEKLNCPAFESTAAGLASFEEYNKACILTEPSDTAWTSCCWYQCEGLPMETGTAFANLCRYSKGVAVNFTDVSLVTDWEVLAMHEVTFKSISSSMWWAAVTMTTVGYGDMVPTYWLSRCVGVCAMISGLLIIAMPFAIVGAKLGEAMQRYVSPDGRKNGLFSAAEGTEKEADLAASQMRMQIIQDLHSDVQDSLELKQQILQLQELRDNLWTSIEHAMATMVYEGLVHLKPDTSEHYFRKKMHRLSNQMTQGTIVSDREPSLWSCYCFEQHSRVRELALRLTNWFVFDWLVVSAILLNSAILMIQDYYPYEENDTPWPNRLQSGTDQVFIAFFSFECLIKIVAQGFILESGTYLRDGWNWIDFVVVLAGLMSIVVPQGDSLTVIRTVRVLRPLRTFSAMPTLRNLFNTILKSLPGLRDVVLLASFLMVTFGILGLHLFGGVMHRHCRLTPQPLHFTQNARTTSCKGLCFDAAGGFLVDSSILFDVFCAGDAYCSDAYLSGEDYYLWPVDPGQQDRFCHEYLCKSSSSVVAALQGWTGYEPGFDLQSKVLTPLGIELKDGGSSEYATYCGSGVATDESYSPGTTNETLKGITLNHYWDIEKYSDSFNWGLTKYDNLGWSILVVFQCITLEGWTTVMYMLQDAASSVLSFPYFLLLVTVGSFFLLNIVLAIVWDAFMDVKDHEKTGSDGLPVGGPQSYGRRSQSMDIHEAPPPMTKYGILQRGRSKVLSELVFRRNSVDIEDLLLQPHEWRVVRWARMVASNSIFQGFIILIITMNVIVLAMDRYPEPLAPRAVVTGLSQAFNIIFMVEFLILHVAVLPLRYWGDNTLAFDGIIVAISVVELISDIISTSSGEGGGSAVTALRAFRLLRIFKLAKKFKSMNILMKASIATVLGMRDFVLLLFLIICIFALIGQSFFGGKFMFDDYGTLVEWTSVSDFWEKCPVDGNKPSCVPRAHFDTWLWSFTTIFQILTGEDWNSIMYDGMKATGWYMFAFFWVVMLFGNFVILNLFLAYLMYNFEAQQNKLKKQMQKQTTRQKSTRSSANSAFIALRRSKTAQSRTLEQGPPQRQKSVRFDRIMPQKSESQNSVRHSTIGPEDGAHSVTSENMHSPFLDEDGWPTVDYFIPSKLRNATIWNSLKRKSFLVLSETCLVRRLCLKLVTKNPWFDQSIAVLICLSSLMMMFQNPLNNQTGIWEKSFFYANMACSVVFAGEMIVKMIAFGVVFGSGGRPAYLQSSWNLLDSFIVIISLYDIVERLAGSDTGTLSFAKTFRMARMLRPLRIISRNENLKVVVKTIGASLPQLRILLMFSMLFFLIFALLGVSMFKGSFYTCQVLNSDGSLEDFSTSDNWSTSVPLCIPPGTYDSSASSDSSSSSSSVAEPTYGLRFAELRGDAGCTGGAEEWQRGSIDTPICVVHCDGENAANHDFCKNSLPWGYHIMRCTDCRDAFCPGEYDEGCRSHCSDTDGHDNFCRDRTSANFSECVDECEAECVCQDSCVGLIKDAGVCVEEGGRWINKHQHFDTLEQGMISLFEISTTEGWVDLMLASVDSIGPYRNPKRDAQEWLGCGMFISFILLGSFFVLNLCVGVIIDNYGEQKGSKGNLMITDAQAKWIMYQRALYVKKQFFLQTNLHLMAPTRAHLVRIVTSSLFERVVMAAIVVNTICLGMVLHPSPGGDYDMFLEGMGTLFTVFFNVEAVLKLLALHGSYFKENWNIFDFCCVFISDIFSIVDMTALQTTSSDGSLSTVISAVRIFRVARLFRLVRFLKGLNKLFFAFVLSIPKLFNVAAIMLLLIYLYAVLGINLFAKVAYPAGGSYNADANFRTFPQAMSLLIRAMTGEAWNELMHDLSKTKFDFQSHMSVPCEDDLNLENVAKFANVSLSEVTQADLYFLTGPDWEPNACGSQLSYIYFITYTVVVTFVVLNLVIAVIFEGFEESSKSELSDLITSCVHTWRKYDPDYRMLISVDRVFDFIDECVEDLCRAYGKTKNPNWSIENRWDPAYTGLHTRTLLPAYNLKYVKINAIMVNSKQEVRFIVAMRAVLRRLICQGGLNGLVTTKLGRFQRLRELEALDLSMEFPGTGPDLGLERELLQLKALEHIQAQHINCALKSRLPPPDPSDERMFLSDVAAAKLQTIALAKMEKRARQKARSDSANNADLAESGTFAALYTEPESDKAESAKPEDTVKTEG